MAPSASMLFLSYHQLHSPAPAPRKQEEASPSGFRFNVSSIFSLGAFARRQEAAVLPAQGKTVLGCRRDDAAVEEKPPAAAAEELNEKFEEALRLSCWSS